MIERLQRYKGFLSFSKVLVLVIVVGLGIWLRAVGYLQKGAFFIDEAALICNLQEKSFLALFAPLDYSQAAPPLFLVFSKFIGNIFGYNETVFRFLPCFSGVLALVGFCFLCLRYFKNYFTSVFAIFCFAINPSLVWMSQYFKPYMTDVLLSVCVLFVALSVEPEKVTRRQALIFGVLAALGFWFSYTMLFVVFGVFLAFLGKTILAKNKEQFLRLGIFALPCVLSFAAYYFVNLYGLTLDKGLHSYWHVAFAPSTVIHYQLIVDFLFSSNVTPIVFTSVLLLGLYCSFKSNIFKTFVIISPILVGILFGFLYVYPFADRLILYLMPMVFLVAAKPLDYLSLKHRIITVLILFFSYYFVATSVFEYVPSVLVGKKSFVVEDTRVLYEKLKSEMVDGDVFYLYHHNRFTFRVYNKRLKIPENAIHKGIKSEENISLYEKDLNLLPKGKKIWFIFTNGDYNQSELAFIDKWIRKNCVGVEKRYARGAVLIQAKRK